MNSAYPTVWVVGDSTVSSFSDGYYIPRYGYGTRLQRYLRGAKVVNLALAGRSSKSFLSEENYKILASGLSCGDFLVVGFGHNDEKREPERYTNPNLPYTCADGDRGMSFAYCLYTYYIKLARERGATPLLCTPIVRASETDDYSGSCGHVTQTGGGYEGGDYPAAIRRLGRDAGVTVIDLTASSMERYAAEGFKSALARYHAWAGTSHGRPVGPDGTHLSMFGASRTAYEWAVALSRTDDPLKNYLGELVPPAEEELALSVNAGYVEPAYVPFCAGMAEKLRVRLPSPWYGSVMGDVQQVAEFEIAGDGSSFTVGNTGAVARGGVSETSDGFGAAFVQLPADANFVASAECVVLETGGFADGRTAFGMMLRDDAYADEYVPGLASSYIAAGVVGDRAVFCREGGKLHVEDCAAEVRAGARFALRIERVNQQIRAEVNGFGRAWFDFDLSATDGGSDYLCLFAARHVRVRFCNVSVEVTGRAVRA